MLSLMRNPEHSDTEISKAIGMNLFTFNKTKNSLSRRGMLSKYYVPNYGKMGLEILSVSHGSGIDTFICDRETDMLEAGPDRDILDLSIFRLLEGNNGIIFQVLSDYTNLKRLMRIKENILHSNLAPVGSMKNSLFSLKDLKIERFFDVQALLEADIGDRTIPILPLNTPAQLAASRDWSHFFDIGETTHGSDLDEESFRVLLAIVSKPDSREGDLIEQLGISRYKLRKVKDKLLEDGYIKPFYGTNVVGMGYEVLIFTHMKFKAGHDPRDLFNNFEGRMPSNLMIVALDHTEVIGLGIFKNLTDGSRAQMNMRKAMVDFDFLEGEPDIMIFSLPNCSESPPLSFQSPLIECGLVKDPMTVKGNNP
jgi:DNA-binding MarR family transcriptional regulator